MPAPIAAASAGARLIAVLKARGGVRPIGITDTLQKLIGRLMTEDVKEAVAQQLHSDNPRVKQFAIGVPAGCPKLATYIQRYLDKHPGCVIASSDCHNAFQEMTHECAATGLAATEEGGGRGMLAHFCSMYDRPEGSTHSLLMARVDTSQGPCGAVQPCTHTDPSRNICKIL